MQRAALLAWALMAVAACAPQPGHDGPFAPGPAPGGAVVDPLLVGHRLMDANEHELAIDAYSRAALDQGMSADVLAGLGSAHLALGRLGTAERLLRQAVAKDEKSPESWNNLGVVLVEKGDYAQAEQMFRRAYALDNGESDSIRDNLRLALAKTGESNYDPAEDNDYKLVRRGTGDYLIRKIP